MKRIFFILTFLILFPLTVQAVEPDEIMKDPALELRARAISKQLRCLVCQGEDIDESRAGLARDLRLLVRARLQSGDSDAAVLEHVRARYGDYVLLKPPLDARTAPLWLLPFAVMAGGAVVVFARRKRKGKS